MELENKKIVEENSDLSQKLRLLNLKYSNLQASHNEASTRQTFKDTPDADTERFSPFQEECGKATETEGSKATERVNSWDLKQLECSREDLNASQLDGVKEQLAELKALFARQEQTLSSLQQNLTEHQATSHHMVDMMASVTKPEPVRESLASPIHRPSDFSGFMSSLMSLDDFDLVETSDPPLRRESERRSARPCYGAPSQLWNRLLNDSFLMALKL